MKRQMDEPEATMSKNRSNSTKRKYKRRSKKQLPVLEKWFEDHKDHPYPKKEDKVRLAAEANLTLAQLNGWLWHERNKYNPILTQGSGKKTYRLRFPEQSLRVLQQWFDEHQNHPYPTPEERERLATQANLTLDQVRIWFKNERVRYKAKLKEAGGHSRNIRVQRVKKEENKENPMVITIGTERDANVVPLNEATTSKNEWYWLEMKARRLPESSVRVLEKWFEDHERHPHPTTGEKKRLAAEANLTLTQVKVWLRNKRGKYDKKLKEEGSHPPNIQVDGVKKEENKENPFATKTLIEHESNVVPLNEVTAMDIPIEVIDLYCSYM